MESTPFTHSTRVQNGEFSESRTVSPQSPEHFHTEVFFFFFFFYPHLLCAVSHMWHISYLEYFIDKSLLLAHSASPVDGLSPPISPAFP
jgi:hypothetical protein